MKPPGMTSHDVVARVRRLSKIKRTGHGGTLDPLAEGVLPMALGQACRLIDYLPSDKTYYAEILLGKRTTTDDLEGEVLEQMDASHITAEQIEAVLPHFVGTIKQHPPVYSAIRINGKHLYELARQGQAPEKAPERTVIVHDLDVVFVRPPVFAIRVHCGKGTYIRSLARDMGALLGTGGVLQKLVREKAGNLHISKSLTLENLQEQIGKTDWQSIFTDLAEALGLCKVDVTKSDADDIFNGRIIDLPDPPANEQFLLAAQNGCYIGLLKHTQENQFKPEVVFSDARVST
jgi:tRNA pseudouridine55 synthase